MTRAYDQYKELLEKGQFVEAARLAEFAYLEGNRGNCFWLTRQAAALNRAGEHKPAFTVAKKALTLEPQNPYAILAVAEALAGLRRHQEALEYFELIATEARVSNVARKAMLQCLAQLKNWDRILELIAVWELPTDISCQWRVKAFEGQTRIDEAMAACRQWLQKKPDNPGALWALTELEIRQDGLESALTRMGKLAKIPSRPPIYKEIYASLCKRAGKPELALQQYAELTQTASDPRIHRKQAFALAKSGNELQAIPLIEELLKLNPGDYYLHRAYVPACRRVNQLDRAMRFYEKLLELHPEEKKLYGRLKKLNRQLEP